MITGVAKNTSDVSKSTVSVPITVSVPVLKVAFDEVGTFVGKSMNHVIEASITPIDATEDEVTKIEWKSSNESAIKVVGRGRRGTLTVVGEGSSVITASIPETNVKAEYIAFVVNEGSGNTESSVILPLDLTMTVGETWPESGVIKGDNITSDTPSVVSFSGKKLSAHKKGSAVISYYENKKKKTCAVTVKEAEVIVDGIQITTPQPIILDYMSSPTMLLEAYVSVLSGVAPKIEWTSSDMNVAQVDRSTGFVTANSAGHTNITAKAGGKEATCDVHVVILTENILLLSESFVKLEKDSEYTINTRVLPSNATDTTVLWESENPSIASVDERTGTITAHSVGGTTMWGRSKDGRSEVSCTVEVHVPVKTITITPKLSSMLVGEEIQLEALVSPSDATTAVVSWHSNNTGAISVANGKIKALKKGSSLIRAESTDGSGVFDEIRINVESISVTGLDLDESRLYMAAGDRKQINAKIIPENASSNKINWKSSDIRVAEVEDNGLVIAKTAGSTTISATTEDGNYRQTCVVTVSANRIEVSDVTVSKNITYLIVGGKEQLSAMIIPHNATNQSLEWKSDDTRIVEVIGNGLLEAKAVGSTTVRVRVGGFESSCEVFVSNTSVGVKGVCLNKRETSLQVNGSEQLGVMLVPYNATNQDVTWKSSSEGVAIVDKNGLITGISQGFTTITVRSNDGGYEDSCYVIVEQRAIPVVGVSINKKNTAIRVGRAERLIADINPVYATSQNLNWKSDDDKIATVTQGGQVLAHTVGSTRIRVTTVDGSKTDYCDVSVVGGGSNVSSVTLDKSTLLLRPEESQSLVATISPPNAINQQLYWKSSNDYAVKVDLAGRVIAKSLGSAIITVSLENGQVMDTCSVKVSLFVTSVELNKKTLELERGEVSKALVAQVKPNNATDKKVKWTSEDTKVVEIDENTGEMTALSGGVSIIRVEALDGSGKMDECEVLVVIPVTGVTIRPKPVVIEVNKSVSLYADVKPVDASKQGVKWDSEDKGIADVDVLGRVTGFASGKTRIFVTTDDGLLTDFCDVEVVVFATGVTLNETELKLSRGSQYAKLSAVVSGDPTIKSVVWSSNNEDSVSVNPKTGVLKAESQGFAVIRATTTDGSELFDECNVEVVVSVTGVRIDGDTFGFLIGEKFSLTASVSPSDATIPDVEWSSRDNNIVFIDKEGNAEAKSVGDTIITATTVDGKKTSRRDISVYPIVADGVVLNKNITYMSVGSQEQLFVRTVPAGITDLKFQWHSVDTSIVDVDPTNGRLTAKKPGTTFVSVVADTGGYSARCEVNVEFEPVLLVDMSLNKEVTYIRRNETEQLKEIFVPFNVTGQNVTWKSNNPNRVTVDASGVVTGLAVGSAIITATSQNGSHQRSCTVNVVEDSVDLTRIRLDKNSLTMNSNTFKPLVVSVEPANATNQNVTWRSLDEKIASVTKSGGIIAKSGGTVTIRVESDDKLLFDECLVTVKHVPVTGVFVKSQTFMVVGGTETLTAVVSPFNASDKKVLWSSSHPSFVSVDSVTGLLTAKRAGVARVTAKTSDGNYRSECEVNVLATTIPLHAIDIKKTTSLLVGTTELLSVFFDPNNATNQALTWKSNNDAVASVDKGGLISAHTSGTTKITVTSADGGYSTVCNVTVSNTNIPLQKLSFNETNYRLDPADELWLYPLYTPSNATNQSVTWKSSNTRTAEVDVRGYVIAKAVGETEITATSDDGKEAKCNVTVSILLEGIELSETSKTVYVGEVIDISENMKFIPDNATSKDVKWWSGLPSVGKVLSETEGKVEALSAGTATIYVEALNKEKSQASFTLTVKEPVKNIQIDPPSAAVEIGKEISLRAIVNPSNASNKEVTWSIDEASSTGKATFVADGILRGDEKGSVKVLATSKDNPEVIGESLIEVLYIYPEMIKLDTGIEYMAINDTRRLFVGFIPKNATNKKVEWSINEAESTGSVTLSKDGVVTAKKEGKVVVVVTAEDKGMDGSYDYSDKCEIYIGKNSVITNNIFMNKDVTYTTVGGTEQLRVIFDPHNVTNQEVTWSTSRSSAVEVDRAGVITGVSVGEAIITAKSSQNGKKIASCLVKVLANEVPLISFSIEEENLRLDPNASYVPKVVFSPQNATNQNIEWTASSTPSYVSVDRVSGLIRAGSEAGKSSTVTATLVDGKTGVSTEFADTIDVEVSTLATAITASPSTIVLRLGDINGQSVFLKEGWGVKFNPENTTDESHTFSSSRQDVASVTLDGTVEAVSGGVTVITITATDGSGVYTESTVSVETPVTKVEIFNDGANITDGLISLEVGHTTELVAKVLPDDATHQGVEWSIDPDDKAIASISANGRLKALSEGEARIILESTDGDIRATCKVKVARIGTGGVELYKNVTHIAVGGKERLTYRVFPENATDKEITWSGNDDAIAFVDADTGLITAVTPGVIEIVAKPVAGGTSASCKVYVSDKKVFAKGLSMNKTETNLLVGKTEHLGAIFNPFNTTDQELHWESGNASIVEVSDSGVVKGITAGSTTITARTLVGGYTATCRVTVASREVPVTKFEIAEKNYRVDPFTALLLRPTISPLSATDQFIEWSSDDREVATVDKYSGLVTAHKQGPVKITAKLINSSLETQVCDIDVSILSTGVTLTPATHELYKGETYSDWKYTVSPSEVTNKDVTWSSDDEKVATIDKDTGELTAVEGGSVTITATAADGTGKKATSTVKVLVRAESIVLKDKPPKLELDDTFSAWTYEILPKNTTNKSVEWTVDDSTVLEINSSTGRIKAIGKGVTLVTVTVKDGEVTDSCEVRVSVPVDKVTVSPKSLEFDIRATRQLTVEVSPENVSDSSVVWSIDPDFPEDVVSLTQTGKITALKAGATKVKVSTTDGFKSDYCDIVVSDVNTKNIETKWEFGVWIKDDGRLYSWGDNEASQLGREPNQNTPDNLPSQVAMPEGVSAWESVSAGAKHGLAIGSDGQLYSWGDNSYSQLGRSGEADKPAKVPLPEGVTRWESVSAGGYHSLARANDGHLYAWGRNKEGQLGLGGLEGNASVPTKVSFPTGVTQWKSFVVGHYHTFAFASNDKLYAWGKNDKGQLGIGSTTSTGTPTVVTLPSGVSKWKAVAAGDAHSLAVDQSGNAYGWGDNTYGQIADATTSSRTTPSKISSLSKISKVATGAWFSMAIDSDGKLFSWGHNEYGQLGRSTDGDIVKTPGAVESAEGVLRWISVSSGLRHTVAYGNNSKAYSWGQNIKGELGRAVSNDHEMPYDKPIAVGSYPPVTTITLNPSTSTYSKNVGERIEFEAKRTPDVAITPISFTINNTGITGEAHGEDVILRAWAGGTTAVAVKADDGTQTLNVTITGLAYKPSLATSTVALTGWGTQADKTKLTTIAKELHGLRVNSIAVEAFKDSSDLQEVHIPSSIERLGEDSFLNTPNLVDVLIDSSKIANLKDNYSQLFAGLKRVYVKDGIKLESNSHIARTFKYTGNYPAREGYTLYRIESKIGAINIQRKDRTSNNDYITNTRQFISPTGDMQLELAFASDSDKNRFQNEVVWSCSKKDIITIDEKTGYIRALNRYGLAFLTVTASVPSEGVSVSFVLESVNLANIFYLNDQIYDGVNSLYLEIDENGHVPERDRNGVYVGGYSYVVPEGETGKPLIIKNSCDTTIDVFLSMEQKAQIWRGDSDAAVRVVGSGKGRINLHLFVRGTNNQKDPAKEDKNENHMFAGISSKYPAFDASGYEGGVMIILYSSVPDGTYATIGFAGGKNASKALFTGRVGIMASVHVENLTISYGRLQNKDKGGLGFPVNPKLEKMSIYDHDKDRPLTRLKFTGKRPW
ncbi:MAG: Ig-like domain-containing protein [Treponemataceae bacterium]